MVFIIIFLGFLFGAILQYANLNRYNVISGLATRDNFAVPKAIFLAIGVGALLLNVEIALGLASYHVKPFLLSGIVLGGLIFGAGMAVLGYCPGTLAVSVGEGSLDALTGIAGGLLGGWVFTLTLPAIKPLLGPNLGKISLETVTGMNSVFFIVLPLLSFLFIAAAFWIHKKEKSSDKKWMVSGILLGILNPVVFLNSLTGRPIGASTSFPYIADIITGTTENNYFDKIKTPGNWEVWFLAGAFLAGLVISLIKKEFRFQMIYSNWEKYKGGNKIKRALFAFAGGFILIFGARMAGGCTSGHILSGGMQMAASSLVFALFVFAGLLLTGKFFYSKAK